MTGLPAEPIEPLDLAVACCLYEQMTPYARSLRRLRDAVVPALDLRRDDHRLALLQFLNDWGCRNLAKAWHQRASTALEKWCSSTWGCLDLFRDSLDDFDSMRLRDIARAFDLLSGSNAAEKTRQGVELQVSFGPTATSKSLFALMPNTLPAWDGPMRKAFDYDDDGASYAQFVEDVHGKIAETDQCCRERGLELVDLPAKLGRPAYTTVAQLVVEYYWITVTRGVSLPASDVLSEWLSWCDSR